MGKLGFCSEVSYLIFPFHNRQKSIAFVISGKGGAEKSLLQLLLQKLFTAAYGYGSMVENSCGRIKRVKGKESINRTVSVILLKGGCMQEESRKLKYIRRSYHSRARYWQSTLVCMALSCLLVSPVYAASFDCGKAATEMEKTICSDPKLSVLDEELAKVYGGIKKQLKNEENLSKEFVKDQRDWLDELKQKKTGNIACVVDKECLTISYQKRIKELQTKLDLLLKKAPCEELVMERLTNNLEQLKKMLQEAKDIKVSEMLASGKPTPRACEQILKNIARAVVPKPTVFANTPKQKKEIFLKLREMAYYNQKLFFAQGTKVKDMKKYTENYEYAWNGPWTRGVEYDEDHNNSAFMFFAQPDVATGAKQPITVTVLLDSYEEGLSLRRDMLGPDGLWLSSPYSQSTYSFEYWLNLPDEQHLASPSESGGIFAIGDDLVFWELNALGQTWILYIGPVRDPMDGRMIPCSFEFQIPSKQK